MFSFWLVAVVCVSYLIWCFDFLWIVAFGLCADPRIPPGRLRGFSDRLSRFAQIGEAEILFKLRVTLDAILLDEDLTPCHRAGAPTRVVVKTASRHWVLQFLPVLALR